MTNTKLSLRRFATGVAFTLIGSLALVGCSAGGSGDSADGTQKIVIGTDDGNEPHWTVLKNKLSEEGIDLDVRTLNDGVQLNQGVQDGELDVNLFQHLIFLSQFNVNNNGTLVPVGATAVYPLALYSEKYKSVDELPEHSTIAIPNNPTNLARGLLNLQRAGLLTLKDGGNALSTPADIETSKVELKPVDSNQTVAALKDGSAQAAIVNNTQAQKGGLGDELIIFKEDLNSAELAPYINAFVTRDDKKDDPRWQKLVDAYHSPEVEAAVTELNQGNLLFKAEWTPSQLQDELTRLQDQLKATK
ncbi:MULTISPECIES: MetQ/NlpA family ABC transporter substrate-binding protein [unclassified Pseudoclavibacter]|uniref:MetQ/NlpA family ABC transporter substrate-binding protein n=1 Tax=unclassified Pseudoclavibacter TaxID=2615177 RepID=UPI0013013BD6|nr:MULTISPECIES: MetQ/NlpA family ABC transporter substrate-binding protein [unclassified Pseudoclavibacter]KAB1644485.1 ABC transporter [Pseudoclavibacter sp. CFCC 14310]KAB1664011.1 ABC transporter [Pseudoclavibacter sp. CFCC 13611]